MHERKPAARDGASMAVTTADDILVRGHSLVGELLGRVTFTEMFLLDLDGELPAAAKVRVVDAILVTLTEHGITPSTLAARVTLDGAPESVQGAMAAGLLGIGSRFLGTIEQVATVVQHVAASGEDISLAAQTEVARIRERGGRVPGVGHNLHDGSDPRSERLLALAREEGFGTRHAAALRALHRAAQSSSGRPLVLNAAGPVGAILSDLGYRPPVVRGFAVLARCAGILAHVADELRDPIARETWQRINREARPEPPQELSNRSPQEGRDNG